MSGKGRGKGRGQPRREQTSSQGNVPGDRRGQEQAPGQARGEPPPTGATRGRGERRALQQPARSPPGFFEAPDAPRAEPMPEPPKKEKPKMRTMDPEELGFKIEQLALTTPLPKRPETGNLGRRIKLISNCFPIKLPSGFVYHYDVEVTPRRRGAESEAKSSALLPAGADKKDKKYRCLSTKRNREVVTLMLETNANFAGSFAAYDGQKNMYTRKPLTVRKFPLKCEVIVPDENPGDPNDPRGPRQDIFDVVIKPVRKKDSDSCAISLDTLHALFERKIATVPQETIMAIETILRHGPCLRYTPVGRSFFYPPKPDDLHPLGGGREIWFGYHQSLRLGEWKAMVNLDLTATTFFSKGPITGYVAEFFHTDIQNLERKALTDLDIKKLSSDLRGMRIAVNHLTYPRKYKIVRVIRDTASRFEFTAKINGQERRITIANYFQQTYRRNLKYPNLPLLQVNPESKKIYLPMEVCDIVEGQHCKKKLEERQTAEMIKFTARPPKDRFNEIRNIVDKAAFQRDPYVNAFGFEVSRQPLSLEGRVLDAPTVRYSHEKNIKPRDGVWNMERTQFFQGAEINNWVLLSFANSRFCSGQNLDRFAQLLVQIAGESGIRIKRPSLIDTVDQRRCNIKKLLEDMKQKHMANLVVVVIPAKNKNIYGEIKQAAETLIGLTTQCVKDDNVVKKCNPALVSNLCQKINAKMGGVNNALSPSETPSILRKPVIIIGADVTHPGPSHEIKPSLAACVGSLDAYPSRYAVTIRAQTNIDDKKQSIEIILDLKNMIIELLKAFYRSTNGKKPEKIIFYRDGVSEGQFDKVRSYEVKCIRDACRSLGEEYKPGISFIVVQKRHHTRFMPSDPRDGVHKMKNVPPGTTVDTVVTHPLNFDFFLCSHLGLQGTSRPAHYTVIEDDNNLSPNDLQKLTYYLCHTYVRCTKSISIPSPVAYAHLAAYRARQHLLAQIEESTSSSDGSFEYHNLPQNVIEAVKVVKTLESTMYFV